MRVFKIFAIVALVAALPVAADQSFEPGTASSGYVAPDPGAPVWNGPRAVLFDNGPLVNSPGTGVGGADESVLQNNTLLMNTLGAGHQFALGYRVADQFTIPAGETWDITNITTFAYQTGSSTTSSMTQVSIEIRDAMPPGGAVVFGDLSTNYLGSTAWSNIYRVTETSTGTSTDRPIMAQVNNVVTTLGEGTYWISWSTDGSLASGPWAPPITINGQTTTGDALQSLDAGASYAALTDTGTATPQGLPFIVEGTIQGGGGGGGGGGGTGGLANPIPTLSKTGVVVLVLALIGISAVLIRRRM
jgi:hypothetical protein